MSSSSSRDGLLMGTGRVGVEVSADTLLWHSQAFIMAGLAADDAAFANWLRAVGLVTDKGLQRLKDR
jgi:hypothetical protein